MLQMISQLLLVQVLIGMRSYINLFINRYIRGLAMVAIHLELENAIYELFLQRVHLGACHFKSPTYCT